MFNKINEMYRSAVYTRADDKGRIFYFSSDDFEGLNKEEYNFTSSRGHNLKGYFYYYEGYKKGRVVIFDHGMGSGHRGYMKEIENMTKRKEILLIELNDLKVKKNDKKKANKILKKYKHIESLNKVIIDEFIDKIIIGNYNKEAKTRDIEIMWNLEF